MIRVIIPTYNRADNIENVIKSCIAPYQGSLFCFYVYDSSTNDDTRQALEKYGDCINYIRVSADTSPDQKVICALRDNTDDFFFLLGDSVVIDFNRLDFNLISCLYERYNVINVEPSSRKAKYQQEKLKNDVIYDYSDIVTYAETYFTHLTFWGASIVRTRFFNSILKSDFLNEYLKEKLSWWLPCAIVEAGIKAKSPNPHYGVIYCGYVSSLKKTRSWENTYYETTFKTFHYDLDRIDGLSDASKYKITKGFRDDLLVSKTYLIELRIKGVLTRRRTKQYKDYINILPFYYPYMLRISSTPKLFLRTVRLARKAMDKIMRFILRRKVKEL